MALNIESKMFNLSEQNDTTRYQSSEVKCEGDYKFETSENRANTECTCLEKENPKIKDLCTSVKELLGIFESVPMDSEGEETEYSPKTWGHDEDTMSWEDYAELTKTWIKQDVYDKNTSLNEILGIFESEPMDSEGV